MTLQRNIRTKNPLMIFWIKVRVCYLFLFDILLRFRVGKIGLIGDIKQTFLQIYIDKNDQNYLRLLWLDNVNDPAPKIKILRFTHLVFGLSSSTFILNGTVKVHLETYLNDSTIQNVILKLLRDLYVDDTTGSFNDNEEAFNFYKIATSTTRDGSFRLQNWASNDKDLEDKINKLEVNNKCKPVTDNNLSFVQMEIGDIFKQNEPEYRKVLGVTWNRNNDKFVFDFSNLNEINPTNVTFFS